MVSTTGWLAVTWPRTLRSISLSCLTPVNMATPGQAAQPLSADPRSLRSERGREGGSDSVRAWRAWTPPTLQSHTCWPGTTLSQPLLTPPHTSSHLLAITPYMMSPRVSDIKKKYYIFCFPHNSHITLTFTRYLSLSLTLSLSLSLRLNCQTKIISAAPSPFRPHCWTADWKCKTLEQWDCSGPTNCQDQYHYQ